MGMHEVIKLEEIHGEYKDDFGNVIYGECGNCRIYIKGEDNYFDFRGADIVNSEIRMGSHCNIEFGQNVRFVDNRVDMSMGYNTNLKLEDNVECSVGSIIMFQESKLTIGEKTSIWYNYDFVIEMFSECNIGKKCMFSSFVKLDTSDGHSIFDVQTGENINSIGQNKFHSVVLDEHVWCGKDSFILGNCHIGAGSIVGARSLAKGVYPNNCIIAGVPGKVIAENRSWSTEYMAEDIRKYGEYVNITNQGRKV